MNKLTTYMLLKLCVSSNDSVVISIYWSCYHHHEHTWLDIVEDLGSAELPHFDIAANSRI